MSSNTNAIHLLSGDGPPEFSTGEDNNNVRLAAKFIHTELTKMRGLFLGKVQYICDPFYKSYLKGRQKLDEVLLSEPIEQSGTFIKPISGGGTSTAFYKLKTTLLQDDVDVECVILMFNKTKQMPEPYLIGYANISDGINESYVNKDMGNTVEQLITEVLSLILFTKYCDLETKIVAAGKKQVHAGEKYLNETASPIEILDSSWFTTVVRSEGFTVGGDSGGFFRLQPFGPGRAQKKLIWIDAFEKSGYVRKAKVLLPKD